MSSLLKPSIKLKSDHFGIEISLGRNGYIPGGWLKSDHFGIEILIQRNNKMLESLTKIRPFWDWNRLGQEIIFEDDDN